MAIASATKESPEKSGSSPSRLPKPASESSSESFSVHSGDTSDRRDVDIMTQVLSSRSEEYRLLFRLPPDEVLVQDFNCALQENILLQGNMYLFTHHICFYSNIFGFETKVFYDWLSICIEWGEHFYPLYLAVVDYLNQ